MPKVSFIVSGVVYDVASSVIGANYTVTLENATNHETISVVTNSSGQYVIDGANLTSGVSTGDILFASVVYSGKNQYGEVMAKVAASDSVWEQNIYMRNGDLYRSHGSSYSVQSIDCSNYTGTAYTLWLLDRTQVVGLPYRVKLVRNVAANGDSQPIEGYSPMRFDGGVRLIQCATTPTNNPNNLTSGVSSAIGDTSQEKVVVTIVAK